MKLRFKRKRKDVPEEIMDMREPGEAWCGDCPDHEACYMGYPCSLVKRVNEVSKTE